MVKGLHFPIIFAIVLVNVALALVQMTHEAIRKFQLDLLFSFFFLSSLYYKCMLMLVLES